MLTTILIFLAIDLVLDALIVLLILRKPLLKLYQLRKESVPDRPIPDPMDPKEN